MTKHLKDLLKQIYSHDKRSRPVKIEEDENGIIYFLNKNDKITMICSKEMMEDIKRIR